MPLAKDFTQGQLQPTAQAIAEQAMPTAKKITDDNLRPAAQAVAEQVCAQSCVGTMRLHADVLGVARLSCLQDEAGCIYGF